MLAKLIFVGFFPPMQMTFVLQTPALNPFSRKKLTPKKIMRNNKSFCFIFSYPLITKTARIPNNFIVNVRVMDVNFIVNNTFVYL